MAAVTPFTAEEQQSLEEKRTLPRMLSIPLAGAAMIAVGQGVCGTAAERRETLVVPDVLAFPGHIACDAASRSEIVVPILQNGTLRGVLDVDSPERSRFDDDDRAGLEEFVRVLTPRVDWGRV